MVKRLLVIVMAMFGGILFWLSGNNASIMFPKESAPVVFMWLGIMLVAVSIGGIAGEVMNSRRSTRLNREELDSLYRKIVEKPINMKDALDMEPTGYK